MATLNNLNEAFERNAQALNLLQTDDALRPYIDASLAQRTTNLADEIERQARDEYEPNQLRRLP